MRISLYMNSLNNLLVHQNPIKILWQEIRKTAHLITSLPKNMTQAKHRYSELDSQYAVLSNYIDGKAPKGGNFDIYR